MATYDYNSTQEAEKATTLKYNAREVNQALKLAEVDYVLDATETATDTVKLWTPPKNTTVVGYIIKSDAIATTATVDLGVEGGAADSIADGIDVAAAGVDSAFVGFVEADGKDIYLTFATLDTPVAAKTLNIGILYAYNT